MDTDYEVKITRQATDQMKKIMYYISKELLAPEAANHLLDKMKEAIMSLADFPKRNTLIEEEPWRSEGVRKMSVNNFLIYYWVDDEKKKVQVTAVIYQKREQLRQLMNMDFE